MSAIIWTTFDQLRVGKRYPALTTDGAPLGGLVTQIRLDRQTGQRLVDVVDDAGQRWRLLYAAASAPESDTPDDAWLLSGYPRAGRVRR